MTDFLALAQKRQSTRAYTDQPVEQDKIDRCIEAARLAPSACNSQPWTFIVVDDPDLKADLARETEVPFKSMNQFTRTCPILVVVVTEPSNRMARFGGFLKGVRYNLIDIGIAAEHFCLQATEEGLGTCLIGWNRHQRIKRLLRIPRNRHVDLVIALGYPESDDLRPKKRKTREEMLRFNDYY